MVSVFLSHSSKDKPFVRELADFLRREGGIKVWLDEGEIAPGQNIVSSIRKGLDSDFVLLVLSPDSVRSNWVEEEWTDAVWEQVNRGRTKLVPVLYRDCSIPRLLRNKKYVDLRTNQPEGFRAIRTFLLTQKLAEPTKYNQLPARPPLFVGREDELAELRARLQAPGSVSHITGRPGQGKTTLAIEFAYRYQQDFEAVYWLPCQSLSLPLIASELQRLLGLKLEGDLDSIVRELKGACSRKRCLLILDNVEDEEPGKLIPGGGASVLVATRAKDLRFLRLYKPLELPVFTEQQCFEVFEKVLVVGEVQRHRAECEALFRRLGYLPIGVSVAAGLIQEDVRYTIASVARNLPASVTELIHVAVVALDGASRDLLAAMASCAAEGFRLELAGAIAGLDGKTSLGALQKLVSRSLVDEVDRDERRYRLHALVREAAGGEAFARKHAEAVRERFKNWETDWRRCEEDLPDFYLAFDWAIGEAREVGPDSIAGGLAFCGFALTRRIGRLAEAFDVCERMCHAAKEGKDSETLQMWLGNLAVILQAWGRLEEALRTLETQQAICRDLGNKDGLQRSYGNQVLILEEWGQLDEAWTLLKTQEAICHDLGNRDGLQICYGNQALILQAWGRLEEALRLLKTQEEICRELGNKDGLQRSYGNQALILKNQARLEDALALHQKKEEICRELGNKDGLQCSLGNQAGILYSWGRLNEAFALYEVQEAICLDLGNRDSLQISYGNQALIHKDCGRLEEALALHQKQEVICLELGNRGSLGYCYWQWGSLAHAFGDWKEERKKLEAALALFTELKMPRERDAVAAELARTKAAGAS